MPAIHPGRSGRRTPVQWLRRYLGYSRGEARGLIVLLGIMLGTALAPVLLRPELPTYLPAPDQQQLDRQVAALREHRAARPAFVARYPQREYRRSADKPGFARVPQVALAPFNPNTLTTEDWEARGVPHFVAARITKYREAAGGFRAKTQIKKMYGLDEGVYRRLAPYMQLPEEMPTRGDRPAYAASAGPDGRLPGGAADAPRFPRKPRNLQPFDLNLADTTQLMQIRGIGRGRARWVVQQRNLLGGYVHENQLDDIFVLRDAPDLRDSLRKYTFVAPGFVPQRLPINTASFDELYGHPYIRKALARTIVAYRRQHGPFGTVEDLKKIPMLKAEDWEKMRPYIKCE